MASFQPPLAQYVNSSGVYTIIPAGQRQLFQYLPNDVQAGKVAPEACIGTAFTMIARLVGYVHSDAIVPINAGNLCTAYEPPGTTSEPAATAHVDCLLLTNGSGAWPPALKNSVAKYVTFIPALGTPDIPLVSVSDDATAEGLVIGSKHPLLLHGTVPAKGGGTHDHWMIVTGVLKVLSGDPSAPAGTVIRLVANDPEIGQQVFIDVNPSQEAAYHYAVLKPGGFGDAKPQQGQYQNLTAFWFHADGYKSFVIK